jgi:hypothetical protein
MRLYERRDSAIYHPGWFSNEIGSASSPKIQEETSVIDNCDEK